MTQKEFYDKVLQFMKYIVLLQLLKLSPSVVETASRVITYFETGFDVGITCNYVHEIKNNCFTNTIIKNV